MSGLWWPSWPSHSASPPPRARPQSQRPAGDPGPALACSLAMGPVGAPDLEEGCIDGQRYGGAWQRERGHERRRQLGGSPGTDDAGATTTPVDDAGTVTVTPHMGNTCLKPGSGNYEKAGPYQVMTKAGVDLGGIENLPDAGPTTYTIFYPQPFETSCLHPVVAWGNGTGVTGSSVYAFFNNNAASWGIVVIASDNSNVGSGEYHKAAIDYMAKQNATSSSMFYKKLQHASRDVRALAGQDRRNARANLIGSSCEAERSAWRAVAFPRRPTRSSASPAAPTLAEQSCTAAYNAAPGSAFLADWDGGDHVNRDALGLHSDATGHVSNDAPLRGLVPLLSRGRSDRVQALQGWHAVGLRDLQGSGLAHPRVEESLSDEEGLPSGR